MAANYWVILSLPENVVALVIDFVVIIKSFHVISSAFVQLSIYNNTKSHIKHVTLAAQSVTYFIVQN